MTRKTQGTRLFVVDPADASVITVGKVTSINGIDTTLDQLDTTGLEDLARTYEAGLATPGNANFTILFDPADGGHVRLHELKKAGTQLNWAIGFSDGTDVPTGVSSGADFDTMPTTRSWINFNGYMSSYPFDFALNAVVQSSVGIQVSGDPVLTPKS